MSLCIYFNFHHLSFLSRCERLYVIHITELPPTGQGLVFMAAVVGAVQVVLLTLPRVSTAAQGGCAVSGTA